MKSVTIVGAGLVGALLSLLLAKRKYQVQVYEKRNDPRSQLLAAGRSINLALSDRGLNALKKAGLSDKIKEMTIPMQGRMVHDLAGNTHFQAYGRNGQHINSISREGLNRLLIEEAEKTGKVNFHFQHKCHQVFFENKTLQFETGEIKNREEKYCTSDLIFGTDGAFSAVRNAMMKTDLFNYSQEYLSHSYKELNMKPNPGGQWKMEKNALHIWPRKKFMLIALPNLDGSFTCTLFLPRTGDESFQAIQSEAEVTQFFEKYFSDVIPFMPDFVSEYLNNPTSSLVTIKCYPWVAASSFCLLGDAAHAIVPFYGQGMNCGFEDCAILDQLIENENWENILPRFQQLRKPNADAIAELANKNFIEMRDLVADPYFLARKKIEAKINELYPDQFVPLYSLVSFGNTPYQLAQQLGQLHDSFFAQKNQLIELAQNIDLPQNIELIKKWKDELVLLQSSLLASYSS